MNAPLRSATRISSLPQQCLLPQERFLNFLTAAAVLAPAGSLSLHPLSFTHPPPPPLFPHCRSSACSSRSLSPPPPPLFSHCRSSACSSRSLSPPPPPPLPNSPHATIGIPPQLFLHYRSSACSSRNLLSIFPTTAVVPAPTGFFSICPHCPSSDRSRRSAIYFSHYRSSGRSRRSSLPFSHCPSSACPRRSFPFVSPLPQQCLLQQERYLYFLTTAVVTAPPWALPVFPTATAVSAPAGALPVFPTAAAVSAPAGAQYIFPHCRSSARSRRSLPSISPLPQQCPLPQERYLYFPTAAAVSVPAGAFPLFPHCRSSVRSRRSSINTSSRPQQCLLPQEHHIYFPTAAAVSTLTSSLLSPHRHTSTLQQKPLLPLRCRSIFTSIVQHPISLNHAFFGGSLSLFGCCPTISILWGAFGSGPMPSSDPSPWARGVPRARELLPSSEPSPRTARQIRIPFTQFIIK